MKLHRVLCAAVVDCVYQVIHDHRKTSSTISAITRANKSWGKRDRTFISDVSFGIIRNYRKYCYLVQLTSLDKAEQAYDLLMAYLIDNGVDIPDWLQELCTISSEDVREKISHSISDAALQYSYPEWLYHEMKLDPEGQPSEILSSLHTDAPVYLRCNELNISRDDLQESLAQDKIETTPSGKSGLKVHGSKRLTHLASYQNGWFEIQDLGSQMISEFTDPKPGQHIIDACAGAGGKTLHMAMLMGNEGHIYACDIEEYKLTELITRANRNRVYNLDILLLESEDDTYSEVGPVDKVLIDAPCSGTGVLRRRPATKYNLSPDRLATLRATQQQLLEAYADSVKKGGELIYATCSLLPSENSEQINTFLSNQPEFRRVEEKTIYPHTYNCDGFYMAKLRRN